MDPLVTSSLIGAGSDLLGGFLGNASGNKYAQEANAYYQMLFANKGIQWKTKDAKAAGIHPLAALGANTSSFTPVSVGQEKNYDYIGRAGQNIGRAVAANMTKSQRAQALATQSLNNEGIRLTNEGIALQNQMLRRDLNRNPAIPEPFSDSPMGQSPSTGTGEQAMSTLGMSKGLNPFHKWTIQQDGTLPKVFSKATEEALENDLPNKLKYYANYGADMLWHYGMSIASMISKTKNDKYWRYVERMKPDLPGLDRNHIGWNPLTQQYYVLEKYLHLYDHLIKNPVLMGVPRKLKSSH